MPYFLPCIRGALLVCVVVSLAAGCDSDLFTVDVDLQRQVYRADFGTAQGTMPTVACDVTTPEVCGVGTALPPVETNGVRAEVDPACDAATRQCIVDARLVGANAVDVLQDDAFITKVERRSVVIVRKVDLAYQIPVNTLTFDMPAIQIFVGPAGSMNETDPGVVGVGTTVPLAAGTTLDAASAGHVVVSDSSSAHDFIQSSIMAKQTMVFLLTTNAHLFGGAPLPAGALEIDLLPRVTVGF